MFQNTSPLREDLKKFLPNQRAIRAIEDLFASSNQPLINYLTFNEDAIVEEANARIWWNKDENCLNIGFNDGVVAQIPFEQYMRAQNSTGSTIQNASVVGFAGVNGEIQMSPFLADGASSSLYFIGVATKDFENDDIGQVTVFGKVRGIDTTGSEVGETWSKGDILYANPTYAGKMTNVKPTAPNNVIVVAAVLDASTDGEIMVRPTVPIDMAYGHYTSTTDQSLAASNTAYAVQFDTTEIEHGISINNNTEITATESGLFLVSISLQATSSNASSSTVYSWLRKNGTDIPRSRLDFTIKANGDTKLLTNTYQVSLDAGDYVEVMWASSTTSMILDYIAATTFAPSAPSASVSINQIQL